MVRKAEERMNIVKKRLLPVMLLAAMAGTVLASCGNGAGGSSTSTASSNSESASTGTEAGTTELSTEIETLKVYMPLVGGGNLDTLDNVVAAVNEHIEPLIYANIDLTYIPYANWDQQMNLTVSSGEQVDLMDSVRQVSSFYKNGALLPLDDLLDTYAPDIRDLVAEDFLGACTYAGDLYGIPTLRDLAKQQSFEYSVEIANEYGLEFEEYSTLEDLEEQFAKLEAAAPEMTSVLMTNSPSGQFATGFGAGEYSWDILSDNFGVIFNDQEDLTVQNLYTSDRYRDLLGILRRWYQNGYINEDAATSDAQFKDVMATGRLLGRFCRNKPGYAEQESRLYSTEIGVTYLTEPVADSDQVSFIAWTIPVTAAYPEKAMSFLELCYTDKTVVDLLSWGIEGVDYVIEDEENDIINYPDGVDATNVGYGAAMNWAVGNQYIGHIFSGNSPDINEQLQEFNAAAEPSPVLGFSFDNSPVTNELTACTNVASKYRNGLETGSVDFEAVLPQFQEELEAAGIQKIIDEKQRQIDEWAAANS